jgi:pilus assembly protein CpaD
MTLPIFMRTATSSGRRTSCRKTGSIAAVCLTAAGLLLAGCRPGDDEGTRVAGWSMVDPAQRHPIMVTQQPTTISLKVARGSVGLSPYQRAQVISFLDRYRGTDAGNSRLVIEAPSGSANEVASMQAVAEIRSLISQSGFDPSTVNIEAVAASGDAQAPVRISYLRYVAEGPQCGAFPTNLASTPGNLVMPNLGCANQANLAAMIANPADLVRPRASTPRPGERGHEVWEKYIKGESTVSAKGADEKVMAK